MKKNTEFLLLYQYLQGDQKVSVHLTSVLTLHSGHVMSCLVETPTHITHKDSRPEQLPKSPHSDHNTVNKNSIGQSIEHCQHPGEGTHIHVVEQVQPQGMKKKQRTKQRNMSQQLNLQEKLYPTVPCNNPERDTG